MRSYVPSLLLGALSLAACGGGNDVDPRVIPGGGVGDGAIDGEVNVYAIDTATDAPIVGATISVADVQSPVDETGLAIFADVKGAQTISVKAQGYRSAVWAGVNGANVTIPLTKLDAGTVDQATLSGTIDGFDLFDVDDGHVKAAVVGYAQSDDLGDDANNLPTPNGQNVCTGTTACNWSLVSRAGTLHVFAALVDVDPMGDLDPENDTFTVRGYAMRQVTVEDGVNQSGLALAQIEAGNLEDITVDLGTPPAALTEIAALVGIEIADDEVLQLPFSFLSPDGAAMLVPKLSVFPGATYRLTAIAQTTSADAGAQSIVISRGETDTALAAGTWLVPPTGVTVSRTDATWTPIAGATIHQVQWIDASEDTVLEITMFDQAATSVTIPALVALPGSGTFGGRVSGIAADLDLTDFSLDDDDDLITALAAEPADVP
jgi:hypothetical protein